MIGGDSGDATTDSRSQIQVAMHWRPFVVDACAATLAVAAMLALVSTAAGQDQLEGEESLALLTFLWVPPERSRVA